MKLHQLRYLVAIVDNGFNITAAAEALFTSQPGVSKQIRMLEDELSVQLFVRKGRSLSGLTEAGEKVVAGARRMLSEVENIKHLSSELAGRQQGELTIATTQTQARYVLPDLLEAFQRRYPDISLRLHLGTSEQIAHQVLDQEADFAIASGESALFQDMVTLPIYYWDRIILVRPDHPLARLDEVRLADLCRYPIISYTYSFNEESTLAQVFQSAGETPNVVFTAQDPDVIKTYVRKDMGIGIVACMAYDPERDSDLVAIRTQGLFPRLTTWVGFRKDRFLSEYMYSFLQLMVPGSSRDGVAEAITAARDGEQDADLAEIGSVNEYPGIDRPFPTCCEAAVSP